MSMIQEPAAIADLRHGLSALRGSWWWFVALGVLLVLFGFVALGSVVAASLATAVTIGMLMLLGGGAESIGAFWCRGWSGFFFHLLSGLLSIVVGLIFIRAPAQALFALTLLLACFLMVSGAFTIIAAISYRFATWIWPLLGGVVDFILGVMIWNDLPASALWVIGMFLGINLIFRGVNWIALGLALKRL